MLHNGIVQGQLAVGVERFADGASLSLQLQVSSILIYQIIQNCIDDYVYKSSNPTTNSIMSYI